MKTFDDLEFKPHPSWSKLFAPEYATAKQARMDFDDGWGVSVLTGYGCYGGDEGLYEMGVFHDGNLHYSNPVADGDVCGHLTQSEVTDLMLRIQEYGPEEEVAAAWSATDGDDS